ncbi:3-deoxy-D-arabinoheptulosonate-7-phosphate synthase [Natranaerovirga pectinivora]|uniref:Phospho-2-dehydro-3-deoxyheptonate aldolase n=1 Tax=Natranaerovirga pectinivora TaxID=682400 RepID=A0A4R3MRU2_9FIRM|nr:3-deoxy-7-phosphoheptulonate synthase [Natranaerovirga pectinivora]TCT15507.1 3-deoxy-D-arabinoheptulosonate-7-phosphate synthase [Natranaerovirga pectinivora]
MSFQYIQQLPEPYVIKNNIPVPAELQKLKIQRDEEIRKVFTGESDKFILIIGPCSSDNEDSVCDYISKLSAIQEKVSDKILMIPRVYTNKPRTTGEGYKGMVHQPDPSGKSNMLEGIKAIRNMHIRAGMESGLTTADEMLYPENYAYLDDLLSYVAVGARSVENQQHRLTASGIDIPVGMKNPTSGDVNVMFNSIKAAQIDHTYIYRGHEVETSGNPLAHAILRGAVDHYGRSLPNYHFEDLKYVIDLYAKMNLHNPAIIIDTNHANSNKQYQEQPRIALEVVRNRNYDSTFKKAIKGLMIESYLVGGRQEVNEGVYGKSITDPCIGWDVTEKMIYDIADKL